MSRASLQAPLRPQLTPWESRDKIQQMGTDRWETLLPGLRTDVSAGAFLHHMSGISQQWHKILLITHGSGTAAMRAVFIRP